MSMSKLIFKTTKRSKTKYENMSRRLMVNDLILLLLYVGQVRGNTKLQKQIFLTWKQLFPKLTVDPMFFPWKYGAYSKVVDDSVKILATTKEISVKKGRGEGRVYQITPVGIKVIEKRIRDLKINLEKLRDKKTDWDDWTTKGTLRYVYRNYPEYATMTRVPSLKWE